MQVQSAAFRQLQTRRPLTLIGQVSGSTAWPWRAKASAASKAAGRNWMSACLMRLELTGMAESPGLTGYIHAVCQDDAGCSPLKMRKPPVLSPAVLSFSGGCSCRVS